MYKKIDVCAVKHAIIKGIESVGCPMWYTTRWCDLRQSTETRAPQRSSPAAGETRRENLLAIPLLSLPTGGALPAEHIQPILGYGSLALSYQSDALILQFNIISCSDWRPRNLVNWWDFLSVTAHAAAIAVRRHQPRAVLQRRQPTGQLRRKLHVHP